jgi:hypothetical protein
MDDPQLQQQPPPQMMQMPMNYPNPYDTAAIAHLRWKDDESIAELKQQLGGFITIVNENGEVKSIKTNNTPLMNERGVNDIISQIKIIKQPGMALTLYEESHAYELERQVLNTIARIITTNRKEYDINNTADLYTIRNIVTPIIDAEIHRAINGHESKNFRTETVEQTVKQDQTMNSTSPGIFGWGKRRN